MKLKYIAPALAFLLFSSFAAVDVLKDIHLSKEQLSDRLIKELTDESPGSFLGSLPKFGLDITLADFKSIGAAGFQPKCAEFKAQVTEAMASVYFQKQWDAWLTANGLLKADSRHELAADIVSFSPPAIMETFGTKDMMVDDLTSAITSRTDEIKDIDGRLKQGGNPPGTIKTMQADRQKAAAKLAVAKAMAAKQSAGEEEFKSAYVTYKHAEDMQNELDGVDGELNSIKTDMATWANGVSADHKKEVLAQKKDYETKRAFLLQIMTQKSAGDAAFNKAYLTWVFEKAVEDEMEKVTDADVKIRREKRNPYLRLQAILQRFLTITSTIDFNAKLDGKHFVNPDYEAKDGAWKFYYRRGAAFTGTARGVAKQWIRELK